MLYFVVVRLQKLNGSGQNKVSLSDYEICTRGFTNKVLKKQEGVSDGLIVALEHLVQVRKEIELSENFHKVFLLQRELHEADNSLDLRLRILLLLNCPDYF